MTLPLMSSFTFKRVACSLHTEEKIGVDSVDRDDRPDVPEEIAKGADTPDESSELKLSKFTRLRRKLFVVFSWLVRFRFVWSVLGYCKLCRSRKREIFV